MPRRAVSALAAALAVAAGASGHAAAADRIAIQVDRTHVDTQLGRKLELRTTIRSPGGASTATLVAHLNVLSIRPGVYVDPEDWSQQRTHYLTIPAGRSRTITWKLQAVNSGTFAAYVAVFRQDRSAGRRPVISRAVEIAVAKRTTIDSGGILPLAIGIPLALGLMAGGTRYVRRRR
jgi:hypothetical protein